MNSEINFDFMYDIAIIGQIYDLTEELKRKQVRGDPCNPVAIINFIKKDIFNLNSNISKEKLIYFYEKLPEIKEIEIQCVNVLNRITILLDDFKSGDPVSSKRPQLVKKIKELVESVDLSSI